MTEKVFKTPAFISELVHIFHKNLEYIYLKNLNFSQVSLTVIHAQRMKVMTSQALDSWYLFMSSVFSKSFLVYASWMALRPRRFVLERKGNEMFASRSWPDKKKKRHIWQPIVAEMCVNLRPVKQDESAGRHKHELWQPDGVSLHNSSRRTLPQMLFIGYERSYCHCAFNNELQ